MTLDFLVGQLADAMHAERKLRTAFNRDIGNKVLFIKDGRLLFLKGIKLKAIAERAAYFAKLRSRQTSHRHPGRAASERGIRHLEAACPGRQAPLIQPHRTVMTAPHSLRAFCPAHINRGWTRCRFPTDVARHPHEAVRMFADSSAHASSQGFRLPRGSLRATHQSASHPLRGRASPRR